MMKLKKRFWIIYFTSRCHVLPSHNEDFWMEESNVSMRVLSVFLNKSNDVNERGESTTSISLPTSSINVFTGATCKGFAH